MTHTPPQAILHLGQHKTGSKYLQAFLTANESQLAACGITYPTTTGFTEISAYRNSHFRLYALLRLAAHAESHSDIAFRKEYQRYYGTCTDLPSLLNELEQERISRNSHTIVLSAEDLFDMHTAYEANFHPDRVGRAAAILSTELDRLGWEITLVVYLRRPDALLEAHYAQYIKGRPGNSLKFDAFRRLFAPRLHALALLHKWSLAFPEARLIVRPYEEVNSGFDIVTDFMQHVLKCSIDGHWNTVVEDLELFNTTPDFRYIELLREMNKKSTIIGNFFSRKELLDLAFRNRDRKRRLSYITPELHKELEQLLDAEFAQIAREFGGTSPFFRTSVADKTVSIENPPQSPRLKLIDLYSITLQLLAQRLGKYLSIRS